MHNTKEQPFLLLIRVANFFSIAPPYKSTVSKAPKPRYIPRIAAATLMTAWILSTVSCILHSYTKTSTIDTILDLLASVLSGCLGSIILLSPDVYYEEWHDVFVMVGKLAQTVRNYKPCSRIVRKRIILELLLILILSIARFSWDAYVWIPTEGLRTYCSYIHKQVTSFLTSVSVMVLLYLNFTTRHCYQLLNDELTSCSSGRLKNRSRSMPLDGHGNLGYELYYRCSIRNIRKSYRSLSTLVSKINVIYGYQILLSIGNGVIITLQCLNAALDYHDPLVPVWSILTALWILAVVIVVIISCEMTTREASKMIGICYSLQESVPPLSLERKELLILIRMARDERVNISAANFFEVNRTTIFGLLSVTTTYFIIVIQFYVQQKEKQYHGD